MIKKEDFWLWAAIAAQVAIVLIGLATTVWWIPQKWQACQKLYDSRPARIFCVTSR